MKVIVFIWEIFRKFPFLLILNIALLLMMSFFGACALISISPLVDFLIHPDMQGASFISIKAVGLLNYLGLPVTLISWLVILAVFITLNSAFNVFARHSILQTKYAVAWDIMHETFKDFFDAQWYFFSSSRQGTLLNTFAHEVIVVGDAFGAMALFFANILQIIFFLVLPFYLSWQVTVISLTAALISAIPFALLGRYNYRLGILNTAASNDMCSLVQENFSLAKIILGFGNQHRSLRNLSNAFETYRHASVMSQSLGIAIPLLYRPFSIIMIAVALFSAGRYNIPLSTTVVLLLVLQQVAACIGILTTQKNTMQNFFPSYEQIQSLRKKAGELKQKSGTKEFKGFRREVLIEDLTFAYPGHEPVLVNINARIPKGQMIAFVGESGVGKSTLIDMILGFHQPTKGKILIDDTILQDFDIISYRHRLGYVPQDSVLFNMSIKDNLLWARESATEEDIEEACRLANADEFINRLPEGYNTLVGDRGVRLSGGQVQRVALARAILRKPELLILDEATSALDTYSERLIQQAIENIAKDTTVVVIAHRLSTIINADYIYALREGRIIEEGTYADLVRIKGYFNRMVELQVLEVAK